MSILETASAYTCTCQTAHFAKPLGALQSPMAELLNTFAAPSPAERIIVRERILQIADDGSQLDNEIKRVEKILASLRRNRAALHKLSDMDRVLCCCNVSNTVAALGQQSWSLTMHF
ncbi:hypothetical protein FIBSPDRAFT_960249 [Athelia psychrophila]|uniref:Uncharacterized protein n=1 Tax=Athelia psychrophila TaxID=1759441 RepID=A0A166CNF2_9AGAM|nr:hypothetical protein FIBSPDRAFT_960249 [Fibularhizoctonia sp. CBS 109695]